MGLLGNRFFLDVYNARFSSTNNLSDFEGSLTPSSGFLVTAAVRLGADSGVHMKVEAIVLFHQAEKKKIDPPTKYEISKWSFGNAILADIIFLAFTLGFTLDIPDDVNER